jgi:DNA-binding transcriptional ArsR family regulator
VADTPGETQLMNVLKALADPARWSIVSQISAAGELPCATLEETLPLSKPTISYHAKILQNAGLLEVRKEGRKYFYALRSTELREAVDALLRVLPSRYAATLNESASTATADSEDVVVPTW